MKNNQIDLQECMESAKRGDPQAQYQLALCYEKGDGVPLDLEKAFEWYKKAAEQEFLEAQNSLGCCYYQGQGTSQDYVQAAKWFTTAAMRNHSYAQANLGLCYYQGHGVDKDYAKAASLLMKAAQQGIDYAQYYYAQCLLNGTGVPCDYEEAMVWLKKSAEQGNDEARQMLKTLRKENRKASNKEGWAHIAWGSVWLVGGLLVTILTYERAVENGGEYYITYGAIIYGAIRILRGLFKFL